MRTLVMHMARATVPARLLVALLLAAAPAAAQLPVVAQGGIVNGASFRPPNAAGGAVAPGAIISIFGSNLAASTASAS